MTDHPETSWDVNLGISRRDLLRRGAVVGGALLWTTPIVQSVARPAFAQDASPPPEGHAISYIAVVVYCSDNATNFRAKYNTEASDKDAGWETDPGPPDPGEKCYPADYGNDSGTEGVHGGNAGLSVTVNASDPSKATLTVPASLIGVTCAVSQVAATAFGGGDCQSIGPVGCVDGCTLEFDL